MFISFLNQFVREEDGQDMVEYALLLAFIGLAGAALLGGIGTNIKSIWNSVSLKVSNATATATLP